MQWLVNLFNHSKEGQQSLEDVVTIIGHQLRALGHTCVWEKDNARFLPREDGINLIVEGFYPEAIRQISEGHASGARFVILATEEPTPKGFNYGHKPELVNRQRYFPEAAKFADAIIHLIPGEHVTEWYAQHAPVAYCELGYAPTLVRSSDIEPTWEFGFYGALTARRAKILKYLARRIPGGKGIRIVADFKDAAERDARMREAKVILQIRKADQLGFVSSSRCNTALCLGRPVVAEPHQLSHPWDEVVTFTPTLEAFYNAAIMAKTNWKSLHAAQFAKFKERFAPEVCLGQALQQVGLV